MTTTAPEPIRVLIVAGSARRQDGCPGLDGKARFLMQRMAARLTATHVISEGCQIAVEGYRQAGQNAIFEAAPFERRLRDALSASQQVQGRASHFVTAGRHLLGLPPDTTMFI